MRVFVCVKSQVPEGVDPMALIKNAMVECVQ